MDGGIYVVADDDGDENDGSEAAQNEILTRNLCNFQCSGIPSRMRKKITKSEKKMKDVFVATKGGNFAHRPVDLVCSQFPTNADGSVGVDVSCGAMNAFSKDIPYNSAGLSLARSVDTNVGGLLSQNMKRRRRPTVISSLASSPLSSKNNEKRTRRRLTVSGINMPTSNIRGSFRPYPGVERFNYAKALLRSDHELEKLSLKIRSEINESELFELAQAAQEAADLGVDNFTGRASTFGGELHQQRQDKSTNSKTGLPKIGNRKHSIEDGTTTHSSSVQMPRLSRTIPRKFKGSEIKYGKNEVDGSGPIVFPEQSLLEHARAAAVAVVAATPAVPIQTPTRRQIRKKPEIRSMGIDSLRDVDEVIPQWKELHSHMRTHLYRANVEANSLFLCEKYSSPALSKTSGGTHETKNSTSHRRTKSFFDNIVGIKILPDFRRKQSSHQRDLVKKSDDEINEWKASDAKESDSVECRAFSPTLSSHRSQKKIGYYKKQSLGVRVPPGLAHSDEHKNHNCEVLNQRTSQKLENGDDRQRQATSLTPRLPKQPDSFDLEVLQITKKMPASPQRFPDSRGIHDENDGNDSAPGSPTAYQYGSIEAESIVSSPEEKRESYTASPDVESVSPASPSNNSYLHHSKHRFIGSTSPTSPSTPNHSAITRRKDSGFNTPTHLRLIKGLHGSVSDEKSTRIYNSLVQSKSDDLQDHKLQDDVYITTPASAVYSQFEPNSIVQKSPGRSMHTLESSLKFVETTHLSLPTIQSSKSENDLQNISRNFVTRKLRTQWQNDSISPPESPAISTNFGCETLSSVAAKPESATTPRLQSEAAKYSTGDDSKTLSSSKLISCINPPHDSSAPQSPDVKSLVSEIEDTMTEHSIRAIHYDEAIDEKKECDSTPLSLNPNPQRGKDEAHSVKARAHQHVPNHVPNMLNLRNEKNMKGTIESGVKIPFLQQMTNDESGISPLSTRAIETIDSYHTSDSIDLLSSNSIEKNDVFNFTCAGNAKDTDNLSVCHSLPATDVSFKTAVQTVQGVAVQTVQGVFSHLSLGSPKNRSGSKEWQSEDENMKFLSNYFYCAKSAGVDKLSYASKTQAGVGEFNPTEKDGERLVCTEPCNGRDSPCYLFGIDTICVGLIDLLPRDADASSMTENQRRQDRNRVLAKATARDRSSSISMGRLQSCRHSHNEFSSYQHQDGATWLGMFQRVASERFNFQFQTEENELENSRHPYTPPCLSRKVPTANQTF